MSNNITRVTIPVETKTVELSGPNFEPIRLDVACDRKWATVRATDADSGLVSEYRWSPRFGYGTDDNPMVQLQAGPGHSTAVRLLIRDTAVSEFFIRRLRASDSEWLSHYCRTHRDDLQNHARAT